MYCGKCGSKNLDEAEYCAKCGAKLSATSIPGGQQTGGALNSGPSAPVSIAIPKKGVNIRNIAIIICVAVVAIVFGTMFLGGRSVKTTVDKMITATFAGDAQGIVDLVPDKVLDQVLRSEGYDRSQLDSFLAEGSDELQVQLNLLALNVGSPMETEHTFTEEDKTQEEIDDLNSKYEEFGVKVSAAKTAWVEITVSGPVRENTSQMNLPLIKVGKSWYVDVVSLGNPAFPCVTFAGPFGPAFSFSAYLRFLSTASLRVETHWFPLTLGWPLPPDSLTTGSHTSNRACLRLGWCCFPTPPSDRPQIATQGRVCFFSLERAYPSP